MAFNISDHVLVPKHMLLSAEQAEQLLKKYGIEAGQLAKISKADPAVKDMKPAKGTIVKIVRKSPTAGKTVYYRVVV
ncbi:MAG: DNA-directed RNA polymerase subunit H [Candidatus Diapherotrites archaeon]|uniref:DNA-directed RNA polymerase subunit Rpo5 n=1 Tax=Candidatus Iainarchaeum sp. TaxID=3101447 RepID=A0A939C6D0_9ARCH|nr:DNA-directed RNA polymerase subunit H [Candidatus Diapherotrites archaeon]